MMPQAEDDGPSSSFASTRLAREGNIVVVGPSRSIATPLLGSDLVVYEVRGMAGPADTSTGTRAIVVAVVDDDVEHAMEWATLVRAWAHESVLPVVFVSESSQQARSRALWQAGLCSFGLDQDSARLARFLTSLDEGRQGLPDDVDVDLAFRMRQRLRHPACKKLGVGIDVFVANRTVFLVGLLAPAVMPAQLTALLAPLGDVRLNTDGLLSGVPQDY